MQEKLAELKKSGEFLQIVMQNISSAVFLVNNDFKIYSLNNNAEAMMTNITDAAIKEMCGNAIGCIHAENYNAKCGEAPECDNCSLRNSIKNTFQSKKNVSDKTLQREFIVNGVSVMKTFKFSMQSVAFNDEQYLLMFFNDVSEAENQKAELLKLNDEKNRYIGIVSHDLRSPLSTIIMYCNYLLEDGNEFNRDTINEFVNSINETSVSMLEMVEDLLDVTKIVSGTIKLSKKEIEYVSFINYLIKLKRAIAETKSMSIELKSSVDEIYVMADPKRIEQVMLNLLSNAIKYSTSNTKITIKITPIGNMLFTEVVDQGQGISEENTKQLFKPFQTAGSKSLSGEKSTGLGLYIVKSIVEAHKGYVGVKSVPGKGSNFYFSLPV